MRMFTGFAALAAVGSAAHACDNGPFPLHFQRGMSQPTSTSALLLKDLAKMRRGDEQIKLTMFKQGGPSSKLWRARVAKVRIILAVARAEDAQVTWLTKHSKTTALMVELTKGCGK